MAHVPTKVRVRMYQVGFGDCFLLSFEYAEPLEDGRSERHLLLDYGTTRSPRQGRAKGRMRDVAELLKQHTGGRLDVLVMTHRHRDHVQGFGDKAGAAALRELAPSLVLRPWTEEPELAADANGPAVGERSLAFAARLAQTQDQVARLADKPGLGAALESEVQDQLKNAEAVALLAELSEGGKGRYLFADCDPGTDDVLPGVRIRVLGPATLDQDPGVEKMVEEHEQYWMDALHASLRKAAAGGSGSARDDERPQRPVPLGPGPVRWLVERLADQKTHSVARLVRKLDDVLNNTSLILLLEVGNLRLLLPGDAQIENWARTLKRLEDDAELRTALASIDLYKVGHHGSRNATPRSLHALWAARDDDLPPLVSLLSTRPGVHGETAATAVPRETLVAALQEVSELISTDDLEDGEPFVLLEAPTSGGPFVRQPAP